MTRLVYFIEAPSVNLIKIGSSRDPEERLTQLRLLSPVPLEILAVIPGGYEREMELHKQFAHLRSHGEWFHSTDELSQFVYRRALAYLWNKADRETRRWFLSEVVLTRPVSVDHPGLDRLLPIEKWHETDPLRLN